MWVWYHYIGGDCRLRLECYVTCTIRRQTSCHSELMGWCVTSEMRAKIRAADWRRATGISAGGEEPCGGGSRGGLESVRFVVLRRNIRVIRWTIGFGQSCSVESSERWCKRNLCQLRGLSALSGEQFPPTLCRWCGRGGRGGSLYCWINDLTVTRSCFCWFPSLLGFATYSLTYIISPSSERDISIS